MYYDKKMIFQLSSKVLWGFRMDLEITDFVSLESLISCFKRQLVYFCSINHLDVLRDIAQSLMLHIHDCTTLNDLILHVSTLNANERVVYICDHISTSK